MPRNPSYRVQVRQAGEPWRTLWSGTSEPMAREAAERTFAERWTPYGLTFSIPRNPHVRVMTGKTVVLALDNK